MIGLEEQLFAHAERCQICQHNSGSVLCLKPESEGLRCSALIELHAQRCPRFYCADICTTHLSEELLVRIRQMWSMKDGCGLEACVIASHNQWDKCCFDSNLPWDCPLWWTNRCCDCLLLVVQKTLWARAHMRHCFCSMLCSYCRFRRKI